MHPTADNAPAPGGIPPARPTLLLSMGPGIAERLLAERHHTRLAALARTDHRLVAHDFADPAPEVAAALAEAEVLLTCWGAPPVTAAVLSAAPGCARSSTRPDRSNTMSPRRVGPRGITVTSAAAANALPVAEYTLARSCSPTSRCCTCATPTAPSRSARLARQLAGAGNYRRTVGIIGASRIGRRVIELLRPFDLRVLLHDPYVDAAEAAALGVGLVPLDVLCADSDIVSVHAPELPATRHLLGPRELARMPDGATLINTSRGSLVDESALLPELVSGRLNAVLDVTDPEVPPAASPLYDLPNVLLTPHIAGSLGTELHRMTDQALDELERYASGLPFAHPVLPESLHHSA